MKTREETTGYYFWILFFTLLSSINSVKAADSIEINTSACDTVRREVTSSAFKEEGVGGGGSLACTEFTVKVKTINNIIYGQQYEGLVEKYRDERGLEKKEITASNSAELTACGQKSVNLAIALTNNKFQSESLTTPIRESFSTISFKYAANVRYYKNKGYISGAESDKYYFDPGSTYIDYLPTEDFKDYVYGKSYGGDYICRAHLSGDRKGVTGYEIRRRPSYSGGEGSNYALTAQIIERCGYTKTRYSCDHRNVYDYGFDYQTKQNEQWKSACATQLHKCEDIKLNFALTSEWFAGLIKTPAGQNIVPLYDDLISPPTDIKNCADQFTCLAAATERQLTENVRGRGIQRVPDNFIGLTQNSLTGGISGVNCSNGTCVSLVSGKVSLLANVPANQYYGRCQGYDQIIDTPVAEIPQNKAKAELNIVNRPPVVTVSLAKNQINLNEEIEARCDIVDPDNCVDKIAKVRWQCLNSLNESVSCFFAQGSAFKEGQLTEEIPIATQTNPYRSTVKFKASRMSNYSITCEAWDTDATASASGIGLGGVTVCENCGGVIPASNSFCAVVMSNEKNQSRTACNAKSSFTFEAYTSNIQPREYRWKCNSSDSNAEKTVSPNKECSYEEGSYIPALTIVDQNGKEHKCLTNVDVKVSTDAQCRVRLKDANSLNEATSNLKIGRGSTVEARLESECSENGEIAWDIAEAANLQIKKDRANWNYLNGGNYTVKASLKIGEKKIDCEPAQVEMNDAFNIGT